MVSLKNAWPRLEYFEMIRCGEFSFQTCLELSTLERSIKQWKWVFPQNLSNIRKIIDDIIKSWTMTIVHLPNKQGTKCSSTNKIHTFTVYWLKNSSNQTTVLRVQYHSVFLLSEQRGHKDPWLTQTLRLWVLVKFLKLLQLSLQFEKSCEGTDLLKFPSEFSHGMELSVFLWLGYVTAVYLDTAYLYELRIWTGFWAVWYSTLYIEYNIS